LFWANDIALVKRAFSRSALVMSSLNSMAFRSDLFSDFTLLEVYDLNL